jgi:hypothetical protein
MSFPTAALAATLDDTVRPWTSALCLLTGIFTLAAATGLL